MEAIEKRLEVEKQLAVARELAGALDFVRALECLEKGRLCMKKQFSKLAAQYDELWEVCMSRVTAAKKAEDKREKKAKLELEKKHTMDLVEAGKILGIEALCREQQVLDRAFKKKSLLAHPDRNVGDVENATRKFQRINAARDAFLLAIEKDLKDHTKKVQDDDESAFEAVKSLWRAKGVTSTCCLADIAETFENEDAFQKLSAGARRQAFAEYQTKIKKEEAEILKREAAKKKEAFQTMLSNAKDKKAISSSKTPFEHLAIVFQLDPRYRAVPDDDQRKDFFEDWRWHEKKKKEQKTTSLKRPPEKNDHRRDHHDDHDDDAKTNNNSSRKKYQKKTSSSSSRTRD